VKTYEEILAALADPTRRAIFERLRQGPSSVGELAADLPVSRPAVSQHLRVLKESSLVRCEPQGTRNVYHVNPRGLEPLRSYLESFWDEVLSAFSEAVASQQGGRDESREP
jgi:DNA-binding transcriptional ArsR family regulator